MQQALVVDTSSINTLLQTQGVQGVTLKTFACASVNSCDGWVVLNVLTDNCPTLQLTAA